MGHKCNPECELGAKEYAHSLESDSIKSTYLEDLGNTESIREKVIKILEPVKDHYDEAELQKCIEKVTAPKTMSSTFHEQLQVSLDRVCNTLTGEIQAWYRTIPICFQYSGDTNAYAVSGPNGHPIILLDYAFIISLNTLSRAFFVSGDVLEPYYTQKRNLDDMLGDDDVWNLYIALAHVRNEFWEGCFSDTGIYIDIKGIPRIQAVLLQMAFLDFIVAHELSHITLNHLDSATLTVLGASDSELKVLIKSRQQEHEADRQAITYVSQIIDREDNYPSLFCTAPLMFMKYLQFIDPRYEEDSEDFRTHPFPEDRYSYIEKHLVTSDRESNLFLDPFNAFIDILNWLDQNVEDDK